MDYDKQLSVSTTLCLKPSIGMSTCASFTSSQMPFTWRGWVTLFSIPSMIQCGQHTLPCSSKESHYSFWHPSLVPIPYQQLLLHDYSTYRVESAQAVMSKNQILLHSSWLCSFFLCKLSLYEMHRYSRPTSCPKRARRRSVVMTTVLL